MNYDLGAQGLLLLALPALAFGVISGLLAWRTASHWIGAAAGVAWFLGGLFMSEVVFGSETTEANLQPLIDGLLWDESLLGGFIAGGVVAVGGWLLTRHSATHGTTGRPAH